jgi:hypothetical protein
MDKIQLYSNVYTNNLLLRMAAASHHIPLVWKLKEENS